MPGPDPGLSGPGGDNCISIRPGAPSWWASNDINLNPAGAGGPASALPGQADAGVNKIVVTVRKTAGCEVQAANFLIDLWVSNPSVGVLPIETPVPPGGLKPSKQITNTGDPATRARFPVAGLAATGTNYTIDWTIPAGVPNTEPDGPGHRCLVARCYPTGLTPDATDFHVQQPPGDSGDQHVAQRNICIIPCSSPCPFDFQVANVNVEEPQQVRVLAIADPKPKAKLWRTLLQDLKAFPGFERISPELPPKFSITPRADLDLQIRNHTGEPSPKGFYGRRRVPNLYFALTLQPAEVVPFTFDIDLEDRQYGDAFIFHIRQMNEQRLTVGGLTLVFVRVYPETKPY